RHRRGSPVRPAHARPAARSAAVERRPGGRDAAARRRGDADRNRARARRGRAADRRTVACAQGRDTPMTRRKGLRFPMFLKFLVGCLVLAGLLIVGGTYVVKAETRFKSRGNYLQKQARRL